MKQLKFNKYNFIKSKGNIYLYIYPTMIKNIKTNIYVVKYNQLSWKYSNEYDSDKKYNSLIEDILMPNNLQIEITKDLILTKLNNLNEITINDIPIIQNIIYYYYTICSNCDFIYTILNIYDYISVELLLDKIPNNKRLITLYNKKKKNAK